ncbi:MAG TPA: hypothetical protein PK416_07890 [Thermodesulfobacteriota bacterium]|nr:hypothetical protein [Thermodesulfobacteriota bacterium]
MSDDLKPYRLVRVVGQEALEAECCRLMELGYEPAGSPTMMTVVHPLTGQSGAGFLQAMALPPVYRRETMRIVSPAKPC